MSKQCDICTSEAVFEFDIEDSQSVTPRACVAHTGVVAGNVIDTWGEHGVICILRA